MATAANSRPQREVVDFPPNTPITVSLKYGQGKTISSQYGERFMFSLTDGRVMFLDPPVAGQIAELGINVRENFTITKQTDDRKDSLPTWHVARIAGEQSNGTFAVPALPAPSRSAAARLIDAGPGVSVPPKPPALATAATTGATHPQPASALITEANNLVDAYAEVLQRALTKHEGRVKPDEVRALLISSYIQRGKLSSVA